MFSSDAGLCIFDLDGTLVDTIQDLGNSMSYALRELGLPVRTMEEYTRFVGNGTLLLAKRSLPDSLKEDEQLLNKAHELFSGYYAVHYADNSRVYDGIQPVLDELRGRGVKLGVLTNKPDRFAKTIIEKLVPKGTFDIVLGSRDGVPKKPDPAAENEIIDALGADKSRVFHLGDSDVDVFTAKNAGVRSIGCSWGFRSRQSLVDAGADFIADRPWDICEILLKNS